LKNKKQITIVTPVHNEGKTIYVTIEEFFKLYENSEIEIKFIISEDGSTDNSVFELQKLQEKYDITLISEKNRKGYSHAVIDGLRSVETDIVCFVDSDGQCDPNDLTRLLSKFDGNNIVIGNRKPRQDKTLRLLVSKCFKVLYEILTNVKLNDPSCPYFITSKTNIDKILTTKDIGILTHGFWWEFYARAKFLSLNIDETIVKHRKREYGSSVIFKLSTIPFIASKNIYNLFKLRKILKNLP
tara:strand:+ start:1178 stop:1903 length:726 start_codon:yes stop_codon:yes gene_type:complete